MKFSLHNLVSFILVFLFLIGVLIFSFWRFNIFKEEGEMSKEMSAVKFQIDFVKNYYYQNIDKFLSKLSKGRIEIPQILPQEIGRDNLF